MTSQRDIQRIIILSNSQLVVNFITEKIYVPNNIINLVEHVRCLLFFF